MKLFINKKTFESWDKYSATISNDEGESKVTTYLDVQFKKGTEPKGTKNLISISADDCFFSCFKSKDGNKPKLVIMDYAIEKNYDSEQGQSKQQKIEEIKDNTDDMPF